MKTYTDEFPYCGRQHVHQADEAESIPPCFLGHRNTFCSPGGYVLVDANLANAMADIARRLTPQTLEIERTRRKIAQIQAAVGQTLAATRLEKWKCQAEAPASRKWAPPALKAPMSELTQIFRLDDGDSIQRSLRRLGASDEEARICLFN